MPCALHSVGWLQAQLQRSSIRGFKQALIFPCQVGTELSNLELEAATRISQVKTNEIPTSSPMSFELGCLPVPNMTILAFIVDVCPLLSKCTV